MNRLCWLLVLLVENIPVLYTALSHNMKTLQAYIAAVPAKPDSELDKHFREWAGPAQGNTVNLETLGVIAVPMIEDAKALGVDATKPEA